MAGRTGFGYNSRFAAAKLGRSPGSRPRVLARHRSAIQIPTQAKLFARLRPYEKNRQKRFFSTGRTGFEPVGSSVTGRRDNRASLTTQTDIILPNNLIKVKHAKVMAENYF